MSKRPRLGELLIRAGAIGEVDLQTALASQKDEGRPLGVTLVNLGFLDEDTLVRALAAQLGFPVVKLRGKSLNSEVIDLVPSELAEKYRCMLVNEEKDGPVIYLGMEDPADSDAVREIADHIGRKLRPVLVAPSELQEAIRRHYDWAKGADDDPTAPGAADVDDALGPEVVDLAAEPARADAPPGTPSNETILRALTQLLLEKGVISREELIERVSQVAVGGDEGV
jgi:hypothetical protein